MKIIKEGDLTRLKHQWWYHAECPQCGCVFEFHWEEADHRYDPVSHTIKCPTCKMPLGLMSEYVKQINYTTDGKHPKD